MVNSFASDTSLLCDVTHPKAPHKEKLSNDAGRDTDSDKRSIARKQSIQYSRQLVYKVEQDTNVTPVWTTSHVPHLLGR